MGYILLIFGVVATALAGWLLIRKRNCKKEINGTFIKNHPLSGRKKGNQYAPIFRYEWNGKEYEERSFECFTEDKLGFISGEYYTIYINEKKAKDFVVDQSINKEDLSLFVSALVFTLVIVLFMM